MLSLILNLFSTEVSNKYKEKNEDSNINLVLFLMMTGFESGIKTVSNDSIK